MSVLPDPTDLPLRFSVSTTQDKRAFTYNEPLAAERGLRIHDSGGDLESPPDFEKAKAKDAKFRRSAQASSLKTHLIRKQWIKMATHLYAFKQ